MITYDEAVSIARECALRSMRLKDGGPVEVRLEAAVYTVTFVHVMEKPILAPDYDARVTVDGNTGAVLKLQVGS